MKRTHSASKFFIGCVVLMLLYFILAAIPADAKELRPNISPATTPRTLESIQPAATAQPVIEMECTFPALDGTCSGAVMFQPREQKREKPAARPGSQQRRSNRWQLGAITAIEMIG